ncbi:xanthine dehydrogenase family protein molybdopterin-binding subunit [Bacillus toyonensis]|uniref:xanthine dehydrogenase family protein molybdopterin-binding subunit n=1 Tax=Bacillus toyonensis TaxID=155322 RepID=UPI000BF44499|nr:xanthine dehydrogenase family protein molybdopterin-binding subunit [Bacillus toyonensis]PGB58800.1 carbon monoxide dehydrogenase [Bacillus toyonensis]
MNNKPLRKEDNRFITGRGRYVCDINIPDMHYVTFVRSTVSHAFIEEIDKTDARIEGVIGIFTSEDLDPNLGEISIVWPVKNLKNPGHPLLAKEKVRFVGEPIVIIIAVSREIALLAASKVKVRYKKLKAITNLLEAIDNKDVSIHEDIKGNVAYNIKKTFGNKKEIENAVHSFEQRIIIPRVAPLPMETRGVVTYYDEYQDTLTMWTSTQLPHALRLSLSIALGHPENRLYVKCPDVGGAFGSKMNVYREEVLLAYFAKKIKRPLKFIETRSENFCTTTHGRDQIHDVKVYYNPAGKILGIDLLLHASMGAYLQVATPGMPIYTSKMLSGCYNIPYINVDIKAYYTNQVAIDAYRGAGRPEAIYLLERIIDIIALKCDINPVEIRMRNFIKPYEFPKSVVTGLTYDSGDYHKSLLKLIKISEYEKWKIEQQMRRENKSNYQLGIGLSSYVEFCGTGPSKEHKAIGLMTSGFESAVVRIHPLGTVTVISGSCPAGQGHETAWSLIVSQELGINFEDIEVITGETSNVPWGGGTYGSRSAAVGGSAIYKACQQIINKSKIYLSAIWNKDIRSIQFEKGLFFINEDQTMRIEEVTQKLYLAHDLPEGVDPGLEATVFFEPSSLTFPFGSHLCIVEINILTGEPKILEYFAVDDCGHILHEELVEGQIKGGIVQGMGQALLEEVCNDEDNEFPFSQSFRTYQLPRAMDIPKITLEKTITPSPVNPLKVKGVGEAGTIGSPPAIINAIVDAISIFGIEHIDMPATSDKIWSLIQEANNGGIHGT